jgi:three-Cys-motif partner protein
MKRSTGPLDEIGYWTEIKLDIVGEYAAAYSKILAAQTHPRLTHVYIDAFAGAGEHKSKTSGEIVPGSPLKALSISPPFAEYHLIDLNAEKTSNLRSLVGYRPDVFIYEEDCNRILIDTILPRARWEDYRRALCLLDPYGLHLDWEVVFTAGHMRSVEVFLNFPVMDMNMNVLWQNPDGVDPQQAGRMTRFWGDESWFDAAYRTDLNLFGLPEKAELDRIAEAYRQRLKEVAGFRHVAKPIPMRNTRNAIVYYLFFASPNPVADKIVADIFNKYRDRGA